MHVDPNLELKLAFKVISDPLEFSSNHGEFSIDFQFLPCLLSEAITGYMRTDNATCR